MEKIQIKITEDGEKTSLLDKISYLFISISLFIIPFFFIPSQIFPLQNAKASLLVGSTLVALFCWLIGRIQDGVFYFPKHRVFLFLAGLPIIALISALFNGYYHATLLGDGYQLGTVSMIAIFSILVFLISDLFQTKEKIFYSYLGFILSFYIVAIFQLIRLFAGPNVLTLDTFFGTTANMIGKWNDLGIFSGLAILLSVISLELLELNKIFKALLYLAIVVGFFFVTLANFYINLLFFSVPLVGVLGAVALVIFVYLYASGQFYGETGETGILSKKKIPVASLVVVIVAVIVTIAGNQINDGLVSRFGVSQIDTRPSWQATSVIAWNTAKQGVKQSLLGAGPDRFTPQWHLFKPQVINNSAFWNVDFNYGIGFIPTILVTNGILGLLMWLVFLGSFKWLGLRAVFSKVKDQFSLFLILSSFIASLYLWLLDFLYVPSLVTWAFTALFTGLFFASILREKLIGTVVFQPFKNQQMSFMSMLALIILLIGSLMWAYSFGTVMASSVYSSKALRALSVGQTDKGENYFLSAARLRPGQDVVEIYLSQIALSRVNQILSDKNASQATIQSNLQSILNIASAHSNNAVLYDPANYQNWVGLGNMYQAGLALKVPQAFENAKKSYERAQMLNPKNPGVHLAVAQLYLLNGDKESAKMEAKKALELKPDYLAATSFLAQMEVNAGNPNNALSILVNFAAIDKNDPNLYYQIGALEYNMKNYTDAAAAFLQAVNLNPGFANARYYLALSYYNLGQKDVALKLLNQLLVQNPDNKNLQTLISQIQNGTSPVVDKSAPATTDASSTPAVKTPTKKR